MTTHAGWHACLAKPAPGNYTFSMTTYKNPIILCDYSDPDVIRVGDTFFMTASSFNFMPGLPVLTSRDLVHWQLVNYAASSIPLAGYETPQNARGLWAPSIRFHNGEFYIFVGTPDEGLFYTKTANPYGQWSELTPIWQGKGFEDPCPFWDEDGNLYVVHAYVKSRIGFNSKLGILTLDPKTMKLSGTSSEQNADKIIYDGTKTQPTIEGPKVYKRNGWYYIFAPAGGVTNGWQTVLRSKSIFGPWEEKKVLEQGSTSINGPHQGGLVDTPSGQNWFIHFQDRGIFGRICHLQPVSWGTDDWPRMGTLASLDEDAPCEKCGEPVEEYQMPDVSLAAFTPTSFEKEEKKPACAVNGAALEWQWSANPRSDFARLLDNGKLSLSVLDTSKTGTEASTNYYIPTLWESANVLTQKISGERFTFAADFDFSQMGAVSRSGVVFLGDDYASVAIERNDEGFAMVYLESSGNGGDDLRTEKVIERIPLSEKDIHAVHIELDFCATSSTGGTASFTVSAPGFPMKWHSPSYETKNAHWVGGRFGVYAIGQGKGSVQVAPLCRS